MAYRSSLGPTGDEVVRKGIDASRGDIRVSVEVVMNRKFGAGIPPLKPAGIQEMLQRIHSRGEDIGIDRQIEDPVKSRRDGHIGRRLCIRVRHRNCAAFIQRGTQRWMTPGRPRPVNTDVVGCRVA